MFKENLRKHTLLTIAISTTTLYLALYFWSWGAEQRVFYFVANFLGLFVPFGLWNAIFSWGIGLLLYIPLLIYVDKKISGTDYSLHLKIFLSLLFLFLMTIIVDLVVWKEWASLSTLMGEKLKNLNLPSSF